MDGGLPCVEVDWFFLSRWIRLPKDAEVLVFTRAGAEFVAIPHAGGGM
jgi:hypothetical protein